MVNRIRCSSSHTSHLPYKGTLSTVTFLIRTQRWWKTRKGSLCLCPSPVYLAEQLLLKSQVQIVVKLHIAGANLKSPSFLESLDKLPGYRWDIFSKAVLLEVLPWQHLQRSYSSLDMIFCSGKCGSFISEWEWLQTCYSVAFHSSSGNTVFSVFDSRDWLDGELLVLFGTYHLPCVPDMTTKQCTNRKCWQASCSRSTLHETAGEELQLQQKWLWRQHKQAHKYEELVHLHQKCP